MRKYSTYLIEIIHLNGNKQIKKAKDLTSYTESLSLYKEVKENYAGNNITINFIGVSDDERKIIFTKKNSKAEEDKRSMKVLIDTIIETSDALNNKLKEVADSYGLINKKKSNIEHLLIEAVNAETLDNEKKIDIFNQLREVTLERRDCKILYKIKQEISGDVIDILKKAKSILDVYDSIVNLNSEIVTDLITNSNSQYRDTHLIKEYSYKNHRDRINIMKQIESKYDKITKDDKNKKLYCYNKCKSA